MYKTHYNFIELNAENSDCNNYHISSIVHFYIPREYSEFPQFSEFLEFPKYLKSKNFPIFFNIFIRDYASPGLNLFNLV